jgi:hypothetical protein
MSMLDYVKSLLPSFGQDHIVDDLSRVRAELQELVLPSLEQAEKTFKGKKLKSKIAKDVEKTLQGRFKDHTREELFEILTDILKEAPAKVDALDKLVEASFAKDVIKESITYRKAAILKYIEILSFALHYTIRISLRIIAAEAAAEAGEPNDEIAITPAELRLLDDKYTTWLDALVVLDQPSKDLEDTLASIPDVIASDEGSMALESVLSSRQLDPMRLNLIAPSYNPIYHIRSHIAEHQVAGINKAKEERKLVELRLHDLKNKVKGENDARVEHQITVIEERLKKLDFKIAKLADAA